MTFSIIIPVYNVDRYLDQCIRSVLDQTFLNFEIILVNDGSTDRSGTICDRYAERHSNIKVLHKKNGGVSSARNLGLLEAIGEWVCFIDSDDWISPDYLEAFFNELELNEADFYLQGANEFGEQYCKKAYSYINESYHEPASFFRSYELYPFLTSPWAKMFSRNIIIKNDVKFDEKVSYGEDLLFNLDYLNCSSGLYLIKRELYHYRNLTTGLGSSKVNFGADIYLFNAIKSKDRFQLKASNYRHVAYRVIKSIYCEPSITNKEDILRNFLLKNRNEVLSIYEESKVVGKISVFFIKRNMFGLLNLWYIFLFKYVYNNRR